MGIEDEGGTMGIGDERNMETMEALRTQVDKLQWELNRLEAENRRLKDRNPDAGRVAVLEAELERSKAEVATVTDQVRVCEQQASESERELTERLQVATGQFEREHEAADGLREALRQSEERERLIMEELEMREEAVQQRRREAE